MIFYASVDTLAMDLVAGAVGILVDDIKESKKKDNKELSIKTTKAFQALSPNMQEEYVKEFCKEASKCFYIVYFVILIFIALVLLVLLFLESSDDVLFQLLFFFVPVLLLIIILHPLWLVRRITFPIDMKDLTKDLRQKMIKLTVKVRSLKRIRVFVSKPFLYSIVLSLIMFSVSLLTSKDFSSIWNQPVNKPYYIAIFLTFLSVSLSLLIFLIGFFWQLPYIISSIWKLPTAKWFDTLSKNPT